MAYAWDDSKITEQHYDDGTIIPVRREPGNEMIAEMAKVTEEKGGRLVGISKATGLPQTWVVVPHKKGCRGCNP